MLGHTGIQLEVFDLMFTLVLMRFALFTILSNINWMGCIPQNLSQTPKLVSSAFSVSLRNVLNQILTKLEEGKMCECKVAHG